MASMESPRTGSRRMPFSAPRTAKSALSAADFAEVNPRQRSSDSHLVELNLLRVGMPRPVIGTLPPGDYYAIISRAKRRPKCEVYAWTLNDKLPVIPIPLKLGAPDAIVPLQEVFDIVYQRARYDLSVKFTAPLTPEELKWAQSSPNREL